MKITLRVALVVAGLLATAYAWIVLFGVFHSDDFENQSCC